MADRHLDGVELSRLVDEVVKNKQQVARTFNQEIPDKGRRRLRFRGEPLMLDDAQPGVLIAIQDLGDGSSKA
jgi:hypothetical protein